MTPVRIAAIALVVLIPLAFLQGRLADRPGKKLALASIRYELEERLASDRPALVAATRKDPLAIANAVEPDVIFRDAYTVFLVNSPTDDLTHPTAEERAKLPLKAAYDAVKKLGPDTGYEGGRLRALYEARGGNLKDQLAPLAQMTSRSPEDTFVLRAYIDALRQGNLDERRKAVDLAEDYVRRTRDSKLARLTLLLALSQMTRDREHSTPKMVDQAKLLATQLDREVPAGSYARAEIEPLVREMAAR